MFSSLGSFAKLHSPSASASHRTDIAKDYGIVKQKVGYWKFSILENVIRMSGKWQRTF